ncbi:MAG TPA: ADP-ribosylglycohydrolase family protein [Candidatus Dormibacteraeota bacterium]|nr:ADP-ribosylglycohydrolase family protein [Candidatus Dormibacteraeota bacterium]
MTDLADRLRGAVWGHLIGDALGVPYEFGSPPEAVVWGRVGTHGQPSGTWSDDGGLMLALLDSLTAPRVGFDTEDQARRSVAWLDTDAYKPGPRFDIGGTTAMSLGRIKRGVPAEEAGGRSERDCGNGSLMRILPVALVGRELPPEKLIDQAMRASSVTHAHPRATATAAIYVLIAAALVSGATDRELALSTAFTECGMCMVGDHRKELFDLRNWPGTPSGSGYVVDTFWSARTAFASSESYAETVTKAIRYGSDTDTTAAVAGGLAGALWGIGGIPGDWLSAMRDREIVEPFVARLLAAARPSPTPS